MPPDAEALAELCDIVAGSAPFDLTQTDEHVEGAVVGLDPACYDACGQGSSPTRPTSTSTA